MSHVLSALKKVKESKYNAVDITVGNYHVGTLDAKLFSFYYGKDNLHYADYDFKAKTLVIYDQRRAKRKNQTEPNWNLIEKRTKEALKEMGWTVKK